MARVTTTNAHFSSGEIGAVLHGRIDLNFWISGQYLLQNFVVLPSGGATRRPGTFYKATAGNPDKAVRLIPFIFSETQAYVLEFGEDALGAGYVRFFYQQGQLASGGVPYEIVSPFTAAQLPDVKYIQHMDVMYMVHPDVFPQKLSRSGHTSWAFEDVPFVAVGEPVFTGAGQDDLSRTGAYEGSTVKSFRVEIDGTGTPDTFKWSNNGGSTWAATTVAITSYPQELEDGIFIEFDAKTGHTVTDRWDFATNAIPSEWGANNYPSAVAIYEDRSFWGGCPDQPLKIWTSQTYLYEDLTTGTDDDSGFTRTLSARRANLIRWLEPSSRLIIGALGGEMAAGVSSSLDPVTPTNFRVDPLGTRGSNNAQGKLMGSNVVFTGKYGKRLWEMAYDYTVDNLVSRELTLRNPEITGPGVIEFESADDPYNVIWCVRSDGVLIGLTYYQAEQVIAWHRHTTEGEFESVAVIPGTDRDEVWLVAERTINGVDTRYIELMDGYNFLVKADALTVGIEDAFFVDCGLTYDGAAATTITGLLHLAGETVDILADGAVHASQVVSAAGTITLAEAAEVVQVGLPITARLVTLPYEAGASEGVAAGKKKNIGNVVLSFLNTVGGKVGPYGGTLDTIPFRTADDSMGAAIPLFTGKMEPLVLDTNWERDAMIEVRQDEPLPMTLTAIIPQIVTNDL